MARNDILLDPATNDLQIEAGDFKIGSSDLQHVYLILQVAPGSWKQFPLTGVGEAKFINAPLDAALRRKIQIQLEADGYRLKSIRYLPPTNQLDVQFDTI